MRRIVFTKERTIGCNFKVSINASVDDMAYQLKDSKSESRARTLTGLAPIEEPQCNP